MDIYLFLLYVLYQILSNDTIQCNFPYHQYIFVSKRTTYPYAE